MNAKELRIGNYVGFYEVGKQVPTIDKIKSMYYDDESCLYRFELSSGKFDSLITESGLLGIELTSDYLYGLGFRMDYAFQSQSCNEAETYYISRFFLFKDEDSTIFTCYINDDAIEVKYVHQLQNLYYSLFNEELKPKVNFLLNNLDITK